MQERARKRSGPPRDAGGGRPAIRLALAAALAAIVAHWPATANQFTNWDDTAYVSNNADLRDVRGLGRIWTTWRSPQYYPLTFTSYWIEYQLWRDAPRGYHVTNVLLHALNAALVVVLLRAYGLARGVAFAVALLFAVAPVQVMSVAWVAERKNTLSTVFGLLTLLAFARYFHAMRHGETAGRTGWYTAGFVLFVLALLAKAAWVVLPGVIWLAAVLIQRIRAGRALAAVLPLLVPAMLSALVTAAVEQQYQDPGIPPLGQRLLIAPGAALMYVAHALAPYHLAPFYPKWDADPRHGAAWLPVVLALVLAAVWLAAARRLTPWQNWGLAAFVLFLLPVIGFVPFGNMEISWVSDHFVYYAVIGLYTAVVIAAALLLRVRVTLAQPVLARSRAGGAVGAAALAAVAIGFTAVTWAQIPVWRDDLTLWEHAVKRRPGEYHGYTGRGYAWLARGEKPRAISDLQRALELKPDLPAFRLKLLELLIETGRLDEAATVAQRGAELEPRNADWPTQLARVHEARRDRAAAIAALQQALAIRPGLAWQRARLAALLLEAEQWEAALAAAEQAVKDDPNLPEAQLAWGKVNEARGEADAAIAAYERVLELRPETDEAALRIGSIYLGMQRLVEADRVNSAALNRNPRSGPLLRQRGALRELQSRLEESEAAYRQALDLDPLDSDACYGLGAVLARQGRHREALPYYEHAVKLNPNRAPYWNNWGSSLLELGLNDDAIDKFRAAIAVDEDDFFAWNNLGSALLRAGNAEEGIEALRRAILIEPGYVRAYQRLAYALIDQKKYAEAAAQLESGFLTTGMPAGLPLVHALARLYAVCPDESVRNPEKALAMARNLCEATRNEQPEILDTLGMTLAANGRFDEALRAADEAIRLFQQTERHGEIEAVEARKVLYREGQPYVAEKL
jgi:tetratricopeptide (TPR) repeat protein